MTRRSRKLTINLHARSMDCVDRLDESPTDIVNSSIPLYATYRDAEKAGSILIIRSPDGKEREICVLG